MNNLPTPLEALKEIIAARNEGLRHTHGPARERVTARLLAAVETAEKVIAAAGK